MAKFRVSQRYCLIAALVKTHGYAIDEKASNKKLTVLVHPKRDLKYFVGFRASLRLGHIESDTRAAHVLDRNRLLREGGYYEPKATMRGGITGRLCCKIRVGGMPKVGAL